MTEQNGGIPPSFVETKSYRRFGEMCDACRRARVVGLGYGPPGTGKTESAKRYAQWGLFKPFLPEPLITFTGRSAVDDLYPYRPLTFASTPPGHVHAAVSHGLLYASSFILDLTH
jgi:hypothetical protein